LKYSVVDCDIIDSDFYGKFSGHVGFLEPESQKGIGFG